MDCVPIFYINLDRSTDRQQRMEAEFAHYDITRYTRVEALDGKRLFGTPQTLVELVEMPPQVRQSPGEIGCALSHIRAAQMILARGLNHALVMEDDIHLTFYNHWRTTVRSLISMAPSNWTILQLMINNVRVMRTLVGLGAPFVPWQKNHWSTGAYVINKAGCERCLRDYTKGARYVLPAGVQLVSDVLMFNGIGAYTYTRPLFDHEIKESTIHQTHVELCHRQASEVGHNFYSRFDMLWCGGDDCRAALVVRLGDLAREDQRSRLEWWIKFHLRVGFRWLFLYVDNDFVKRRLTSHCRWLGHCVTFIPTTVTTAMSGQHTYSDYDECVAFDAVARARLAGATWLLRLADFELLYPMPGRSLRSIFDEASRLQGDGAANQRCVFNIRFDNLEVQKLAGTCSETAYDSTYNFFELEVLFKRRTSHVDGSSTISSDDRAYYEHESTAAHLRRLPAKGKKNESAGRLRSTTFLHNSRGRSAGCLSEPGLSPNGPWSWRSLRGDPRQTVNDIVSSRAFVLSYPFCHYDTWCRTLHCPTEAPKPQFGSARTANEVMCNFDNGQAMKELYAETVLVPETAFAPIKSIATSIRDAMRQAPMVHMALPRGCVRSDCGGTYVKVNDNPSDSALFKQQGGTHHLYRMSKPFVAWMIGRTPYSATAALVAHDTAVRPQDIRAPWSAFDGRRWATVPTANVRLDQLVTLSGDRYAVVCAQSVVESDTDTLRGLSLAPPRYSHSEFNRITTNELLNYTDASPSSVAAIRKMGSVECWLAEGPDGKPLGQFLTAEGAESAFVEASRQMQREQYISSLRDTGSIVLYLPKSCGAAADVCAGLYIPREIHSKSKVRMSNVTTPSPLVEGSSIAIQVLSKVEKSSIYRHEDGAHYLYYYAPFSAWMVGSRPGSGSAALIAYDSADRPEKIRVNAPWRVYDGHAWREVSNVRVHTMSDWDAIESSGSIFCHDSNYVAEGQSTNGNSALGKLPIYPWTPAKQMAKLKGLTRGLCNRVPVTRTRQYLVYTSAGDRASIPCWLEHGCRQFDLWVTYYGHSNDNKWRLHADTYRRRVGGKFENLQALWREPGVDQIMRSYDAILVMDDDIVIDTPRLNALFRLRRTHGLLCLQPAFETQGKVSHAITAVQPGNCLRLTNFIEMTCPLFATQVLLEFLARFDSELKGWGADWWFLAVTASTSERKDEVNLGPRIILSCACAIADNVTCINPTDADKGGAREINALQGREDRRAIWEKIRIRECILEWDHSQFERVWITPEGRVSNSHSEKRAASSRKRSCNLKRCRPYSISAA